MMTRLTSLRDTGAALLLALALLTALTTSATAQSKSKTAQMNVFAAASLSEAFPKLDGGERYNFAGSDALAAQIRLGAPADLFAAASPDAPQALFKAGLVEQPVTFATNKLVLAVPTSNPAGITSVYDLKRPGIKLLIGTSTVPIGVYIRQVLGNLGLTSSVMPNVVSQEKDVKSIASKIALGTADAGFMYVTDARAVADKVTVIGLPVWAQPPLRYQIAIVKNTRNHADAAAFIKRLTSKAGRQRIRRAQAADGQEAAEEEEDDELTLLAERASVPDGRIRAVAPRRFDVGR
jgi:molybdate transport system substrate-binding protein